MSVSRPAILDHELKTREQLQQRASRNGGPQAVKPDSRHITQAATTRCKD